jgi:hypothetical protein
VRETLPTLENFLQSVGKYFSDSGHQLGIVDDQIRDDLNRFRQNVADKEI